MEVYALSHTNIDIKRYKLRSIHSQFQTKLKLVMALASPPALQT